MNGQRPGMQQPQVQQPSALTENLVYNNRDGCSAQVQRQDGKCAVLVVLDNMRRNADRDAVRHLLHQRLDEVFDNVQYAFPQPDLRTLVNRAQETRTEQPESPDVDQAVSPDQAID